MNKSKECKAEFDYVAYHYVTSFTRRWKSKISHMQQNKNEKNYVFDRFICEFIIYSALVNVIKPQAHKSFHDFKYSTNIMAKFIAERMEDNFMLKLSNPVNDLISIIESKQFSVVSSNGKNPELKNNWNSNESFTQLGALLETLYYLRCNLFHGEKEFSNDQIGLLKPAYQCLSHINKEILNIFSDESESYNK